MLDLFQALSWRAVRGQRLRGHCPASGGHLISLGKPRSLSLSAAGTEAGLPRFAREFPLDRAALCSAARLPRSGERKEDAAEKSDVAAQATFSGAESADRSRIRDGRREINTRTNRRHQRKSFFPLAAEAQLSDEIARCCSVADRAGRLRGPTRVLPRADDDRAAGCSRHGALPSVRTSTGHTLLPEPAATRMHALAAAAASRARTMSNLSRLPAGRAVADRSSGSLLRAGLLPAEQKARHAARYDARMQRRKEAAPGASSSGPRSEPCRPRVTIFRPRRPSCAPQLAPPAEKTITIIATTSKNARVLRGARSDENSDGRRARSARTRFPCRPCARA